MSLSGLIFVLSRPAPLMAAAFFAAAVSFAVLPACAQYPGQINTQPKNAPELRAVAVLEWTGDQAHPKATRLVPITVFDGQQLQDGGIYLARPQPLALDSEVEYKLEQDGKTIGFFDVEGAAQEQGSWIGHGALKPLPAGPTPAQLAQAQARRTAAWKDQDNADSDVPVLHRKAHSGDQASGGSGSGPGGPAPDPDRPTLHRAGTDNTTTASDGSGSNSAPLPDPDRPTLHKSTDDTASSNTPSSNTASNDPDRPKLKKRKQDDQGSYVESMPGAIDPDRPRLMQGEHTPFDIPIAPKLMGLPPDMHQEVAVSDANNRPDHPWSYSWANPDDQMKMRAAMEDIARKALGIVPPPPPPAPKSRKTTARKKTVPPPPPPAPLEDEQFRVFALEYGSGATMVFSAHTDGTGAQEKFVTLIAQPDLYGGVVTLLKNVTDAAHLDVTPHMRLIDPVDAMADNRGELLFELRGANQRQFALYRVLRGQATLLFQTGNEYFGSPDTGE